MSESAIVFKPHDAFDHALQRLIATSKKSALTVLKQQAKLLFVEVAKVTPPAGGKKGETLQGAAAGKAGKLAIVRDLHAIYGTPDRAYSDIAKISQDDADAFWAAHKQGRNDDAAKILKRDLGKSFVPFDGGALRKKFLGKKSNREALFYITDPAALQAHIKDVQQHVWYLASGWAHALKALGAPLPYGVGKHNGPGLLKIELNDQRIVITMTNDVRYARQVKNLQHQITFAMNVRAGSLNDQWNKWMRTLARDSGLKAA